MAPPKAEPGRDPQMASRTRMLNVVFALTSIGLLITFSLMIWYDYARPWKKHQNEFTLLEVKRTELEIQEALGKVIDWREKLLFSEHHLSHAASAFYPSDFDRALGFQQLF